MLAILGSLSVLADRGSGSGSPSWAPASFDCAMRQAAYEYGKHNLPRKGAFESLYYALNLNDPSCPPTEFNPADVADAELFYGASAAGLLLRLEIALEERITHAQVNVTPRC